MSVGNSDRPAPDPTTPTAASPEEVARPPRYAMVRELGRGGMGRVDEIFDHVLGRAVARKSLLPEADDALTALLVAEAQTCAQLEHPSIVPVYDLGRTDDGHPHYTMRNVRGRTLRDVLKATRPAVDTWPLPRLLGIFRQVCLAVDYAHSRGVIHRDLKPDNVIVGQFGEVYVLDWGIAHVLEGSDVQRAEHRHVIAGSPGYMAPEQADHGNVDARSDVFALGVILYELLTGALPFEDVDIDSVRLRARDHLSVPPSRRDPSRHVTTAFDDLVTMCLTPAPDERPGSARALADAVDAFLDGERARIEREAEADAFAAEGDAARDAYLELEAEAHRLHDEAEKELATIPAWESTDRKRSAWGLAARANVVRAEAARATARAHAAFTSALGRVADHRGARRGLAGLYYDHFQAAETRGDLEQVAQHLVLARTYDDGELALELANEGELIVELSVAEPNELTCAEEQARGPLFEAGPSRALTPGARHRMTAGSYVVSLRSNGGREQRYPLVVERARAHTLVVRSVPSLPPGMIHVPAGHYLTPAKRGRGLVSTHVADFALADLPVTLRSYLAFLEALTPDERARRIPHPTGGRPIVVATSDGWHVTRDWVEGEGKARVRGRELDLPVCCISWYDALAYVQWLAKKTALAYRLPTDVEWDKAMRGVDGRLYPMGTSLDPSFAKLRESRPEAAQPEPVGAFPLDVSPYGVRDLAGGVGDWTSTFIDGAPAPDLVDEATTLHDERQAAWCGGAWSTSATASRLHYAQMARHRVGWVGFRVALSLSGVSAEVTIEPMKR